MSYFEMGMIFVVTWWICLFCVLPFGSKPPELVEGAIYPAAPASLNLARKLLHTTWISIVVSGIIIWLLQNEWVLAQLSG